MLILVLASAAGAEMASAPARTAATSAERGNKDLNIVLSPESWLEQCKRHRRHDGWETLSRQEGEKPISTASSLIDINPGSGEPKWKKAAVSSGLSREMCRKRSGIGTVRPSLSRR
jgi:hypothetical protein